MYGCEGWIVKKAEHQRIDTHDTDTHTGTHIHGTHRHTQGNPDMHTETLRHKDSQTYTQGHPTHTCSDSNPHRPQF